MGPFFSCGKSRILKMKWQTKKSSDLPNGPTWWVFSRDGVLFCFRNMFFGTSLWPMRGAAAYNGSWVANSWVHTPGVLMDYAPSLHTWLWPASTTMEFSNRTLYGRPCKASNLAVQRRPPWPLLPPQHPGWHSGAATVSATHVGPTTNQVAMTAPPDMPAPKASESKVCQVWHLPFKTPNVEHLPCVNGGDGEIPQIDGKITANSKIWIAKKTGISLFFGRFLASIDQASRKTTMTSLHRPYDAEARSCFGIGVLLRLWRQQTPQVGGCGYGNGTMRVKPGCLM